MENANHPTKKQPVIRFNGGNDAIVISRLIDSIRDQISVEFWAQGTNNLSDHTGLVRATSSKCTYRDDRVFSVTLPWTNVISFAAGNEAGYDRIYKGAKAQDYKNSWNHWAFIKDSTTGEMLIYRNGEVWESGSGHHRSLIDIETITIGCFGLSYAPWSGLLSEFRIWNIALTPSQIRTRMNTRLTGKELGLVAYWPLNEGAGSVAQDKTGNNYDGTIQGAVWEEADIALHTQKSHISTTDTQKSYIPTTMTGLQDYSYWWRYAREHAKTSEPNTKTFRRGRIWA